MEMRYGMKQQRIRSYLNREIANVQTIDDVCELVNCEMLSGLARVPFFVWRGDARFF